MVTPTVHPCLGLKRLHVPFRVPLSPVTSSSFMYDGASGSCLCQRASRGCLSASLPPRWGFRWGHLVLFPCRPQTRPDLAHSGDCTQKAGTLLHPADARLPQASRRRAWEAWGDLAPCQIRAPGISFNRQLFD